MHLLLCFLALGAALARQAESTCLPDGIPEEDRKDVTITDDDGTTSVLPIGFHLQLWDSAILAADIAMIIIQEVLGFNAVVSGSGDSQQLGALAIAGCALDDLGVTICPEGPMEASNPNHVSFEVWVEAGWRQEDFEALNWQRTPYYFDAGYPGEEGQYVNDDLDQLAQRDKGWHLDFYGDYDADWKEPALYFDNFSSIPTEKLRACSDTELGNLPTMLLVQTYTPDADGFTDDGLALCEDGYWWLSPACRETPSRCVPFVTAGNGWLIRSAMQRAIAYNMPMALTTGNTFEDYQDLVLTYRLTYYNWEPAAQFLTLNPKKIIFPSTDEDAVDAGDGRTALGDSPVATLVNLRLREGSLRTHQFLSNMQFSKGQIRDALSQLLNYPGDYERSACEWLLNNTETWQAWLPSATACGEGQGLINDDGDFQTDRSNSTGCGACVSGFYSMSITDDEGDTYVCSECAPGTSQGAYRADSCQECEAGYFQSQSGQSVCERCPQGSIASGTGNSECTLCPSGKTTDGTGFRSLDDCVCPENTFEAEISGECLSCGSGAVCEGFSAAPEAAEGYHLAEVSESGLSIFSCGNKAVRCPGGVLGTCAPNRRGPACSECVSGTTPSSDGSCSKCVSGDYLPALGLALGFTLALTVLYIGNYQDWSQRQSHTALFVVAVLAQLLSVLQMVGVISRVSVDWPNPMKSLVDLFQRVTFELDDMVNIGCLASVSSMMRYVSKLTIVPVVCLFLLLLHCVVSVLRGGSWRKKLPAVVSSIGIVVMAFYITISTLILTPFQCMQHPNGLWTLMQYPSVVCWVSSEHELMVVVGILAAIIPVGFVVTVGFVLHDFPVRMSRGDVIYLKMFAFILIRVKPECRWYVLLTLCRNLVLVCVPSIPDAFEQTLILQLIFVASLALTIRQMPWKLDLANYLDVTSTFAVLFVLMTSAAFLEVEEGDVMSKVAVCTLGVVFCIFPLMLLWLGANRVWNKCTNRKPYRWFLCHHKGSSGALARLLKLSLTSEAARQGGKVFLDVDDLRNLGQLFHVVSYDVRTLLVIATAEVFCSPWCIGEVTTAFLHDVETLPVHCADYRMPEPGEVDIEGQLQRLDQLIDSGLSFEDIDRALEALQFRRGLHLPMMLDEVGLKTLSHLVSGRDGPSRWPSRPSMQLSHFSSNGNSTDDPKRSRSRTSSTSSSSSMPTEKYTDVFILVDHSNSEAAAAALAFVRIANCMLPPDPSKMPQVLKLAGERSWETRAGGGPLVLILFFTTGCFSSRDYLSGLVEAVLAQVHHVLPVVASDGFLFPSVTFYEDLEANVEFVCTQESSGSSVSCDILTPFLQSIFNRICPRLSVSSSADVLRVQIQLVVRALLDTKGLVLQEQVPVTALTTPKSPTTSSKLHALQQPRGRSMLRSLDKFGWGSPSGGSKCSSTTGSQSSQTVVMESSEAALQTIEEEQTRDYFVAAHFSATMQL